MISDRLVSHPIVDRKTVFSGMVWDVRHDAFELNGETVRTVDPKDVLGIQDEEPEKALMKSIKNQNYLIK